MTIKPGDMVRYLNAVGGGRVTRVSGQMVYVDDDGFETPVLMRECVVVNPKVAAPAFATPKPAAPVQSKEAPAPAPRPAPAPAPVEVPYVETRQGEKLNVVIGFEPNNLKSLSTSTFDAYLVNDSNYHLQFVWLTRSDSDHEWTTRYAGTVEAGTQVFMAEITRDDLPAMDRMCLQLIAYKPGKPFGMRQPMSIEIPFDTTKFAKLHAFTTNPYFDVPVVAVQMVTDDTPRRSMPQITQQQIDAAMKQKEAAMRSDAPRTKSAPVERHRPGSEIVVDLHIAELTDTTAGMSNSDMLNMQIDKFREVMDANLRHPGQRIVFIHGKGEGVLRQAIMKELKHRYKGHDVQDASFADYGFGATQVTIRQQQRR